MHRLRCWGIFFLGITYHLQVCLSNRYSDFGSCFIIQYLHRLSIFSINCTDNGECVMTA